jgi:hypothetical protein
MMAKATTTKAAKAMTQESPPSEDEALVVPDEDQDLAALERSGAIAPRGDVTSRTAGPGEGVFRETRVVRDADGNETSHEVITQDGYGDWPRCSLCRDQVEPSSYSEHTREHEVAALKAAGKL